MAGCPYVVMDSWQKSLLVTGSGSFLPWLLIVTVRVLSGNHSAVYANCEANTTSRTFSEKQTIGFFGVLGVPFKDKPKVKPWQNFVPTSVNTSGLELHPFHPTLPPLALLPNRTGTAAGFAGSPAMLPRPKELQRWP